MPRLRVLSMRNNRMATLSEHSFKSLRGNIAIFDLEGNPLDCTCDMLWLRSWLESDSQNQGPRCRDGTMLRDARISRSDCSIERNTNQLPLTNEHGDQFSQRSSDVDECENDFNDQQHPFPQDSEYFYDQYVDFPINDTHLAISNNSLPINLNERPSMIDLNNTLLNINQHQMNQALGKPGSQFTFFGMPLPTLNIGRFFGGNRNAKAGPGTGTRGTGRVQIYRPDDPELFKFLQTNKNGAEHIEHRNSNIEDFERLTTKPQDDNHLYYRPYFQTPFLEPQGGFTPMMPGVSGGFRPIVDPSLNKTINETKIWPDEYQEIVPLVTEPTRPKNPYIFKRGPLINIESSTNPPIFDVPNYQDFDKLKTDNSDIISTPEFSSQPPPFVETTTPVTTTTTSTTTSTTTISPTTTRSTLQSYIPEIKDAELDKPVTESSSDEENPYYTTTPFSVQSQKIKENISIKESEEKLNERTEFWENLNHSPSSLSALVAPGAQQNLFRAAPPGRSATITKVQPTPSPTAEEYLRANSNEFEANEAVTPNSVFSDDSLKNQNKNKKTGMDWYFANYNKTVDVDFEPGLNSFKSSGNLLRHFSKLYIFVSILVTHYVLL